MISKQKLTILSMCIIAHSAHIHAANGYKSDSSNNSVVEVKATGKAMKNRLYTELDATVQAAFTFDHDSDHDDLNKIMYERLEKQLEVERTEREKYKNHCKKYRERNAYLEADLARRRKKLPKEIDKQEMRHNAELEAMRARIEALNGLLKYETQRTEDLITICRALRHPERQKKADILEAARLNFSELFASSSTSGSQSGTAHD